MKWTFATSSSFSRPYFSTNSLPVFTTSSELPLGRSILYKSVRACNLRINSSRAKIEAVATPTSSSAFSLCSTAIFLPFCNRAFSINFSSPNLSDRTYAQSSIFRIFSITRACPRQECGLDSSCRGAVHYNVWG